MSPTLKENTGIKAIAGPGHNPPNPHPIPKMQAPKINFASILEFLGKSNYFSIIGFFKTRITN